MAKTDRIQLDKDKKAQAIQDIREYFLNERGEDLGDLAAEIVLDFITEKMGPIYYNQAIADAEKYMHKKVDDMFELII